MPIVTVTRRLRFNAAHRLHNPALSDEENKALFGKCNNPNWHGHNYVLEVAVEGPIDERTGYVIDLGRLKSIVQHEVIDPVDHRNLNVDVEFMRGVNPTAENIAKLIYDFTASRGFPIVECQLWETPHCYATYRP